MIAAVVASVVAGLASYAAEVVMIAAGVVGLAAELASIAAGEWSIPAAGGRMGVRRGRVVERSAGR